MKGKFYAKWIVAIMAIFVLSGCSKDQEMAYYLDGVWNGYIASRETYNVTMEFVQNGIFSSSGYGYEEDCKWSGHVSRARFRWNVSNRYIYLDYDDGTHFVMDCDFFPKYARVGEIFQGTIYETRTKEDVARFSLKKIYLHEDRSNKQDSVVVIDNNNVEPNQNELK